MMDKREQPAPRRLEFSPDLAPLTPPGDFVERAAAAGIAFDEGDVERLGLFLALLLDANRVMNLTAMTDPAEAWDRHVLDALALLPMLASGEAKSVIDVGSGGGVPGMPLSIVLPEVQFTLLEATGKKAQFLQQAAARLGLRNVRVVNERAETVGRDRAQHRERYDAATVRAVGHLSVVAELAVPLVREGGFVLAVKGEKAAQEIAEAKQALHLLHARVTQQVRGATGTVVVIEKLRRTPKAYPRRPGEPKRAPLK